MPSSKNRFRREKALIGELKDKAKENKSKTCLQHAIENEL
ncbi:10912_t:CDS:2 [Dentiscutata erythropus]|uniref:10912_t:CDS:1 n=1 Tax=Dentiscutata erythropus TaxID=1348616 RepID=A0A9N9F3X9_9GLOM|nr:10912_t:CDS:2 [Dentiscutata erythropus]